MFAIMKLKNISHFVCFCCVIMQIIFENYVLISEFWFDEIVTLFRYVMLGMHIVQLFVQYAPYDVHPSVGSWSDPAFKNAFAERVCAIVDEYAPGKRFELMEMWCSSIYVLVDVDLNAMKWYRWICACLLPQHICTVHGFSFMNF